MTLQLNKKVSCILTSMIIMINMVGCQQQENPDEKVESQKIEETYNDMTYMEIMEFEYSLQMELYDQVFDIMLNCSDTGVEQAKEQLIQIQEFKTEPTNDFIKKYDSLLDKLLIIADLYIAADEEGKKELITFIEGLVHEKNQLDKEFEKIMEGAQEI